MEEVISGGVRFFAGTLTSPQRAAGFSPFFSFSFISGQRAHFASSTTCSSTPRAAHNKNGLVCGESPTALSEPGARTATHEWEAVFPKRDTSSLPSPFFFPLRRAKRRKPARDLTRSNFELTRQNQRAFSSTYLHSAA